MSTQEGSHEGVRLIYLIKPSSLQQSAFFVHKVHIGEYEANFWVNSESFELSLQLVGIPDVILIQERQIVPCAVLNAYVPGPGGSAIGLRKNNYLIPAGLKDLARTVR